MHPRLLRDVPFGDGGFGTRLDGARDENEHEQTEDGVKLWEHSQHHGSTECVVTSANSGNTVGTNLSLTNSGNPSHKTQSKTGNGKYYDATKGSAQTRSDEVYDYQEPKREE